MPRHLIDDLQRGVRPSHLGPLDGAVDPNDLLGRSMDDAEDILFDAWEVHAEAEFNDFLEDDELDIFRDPVTGQEYDREQFEQFGGMQDYFKSEILPEIELDDVWYTDTRGEEIGGEWANTLYDRALSKVVAKDLKKYGIKHGGDEVEIEGATRDHMHESVEITPELAAKVRKDGLRLGGADPLAMGAIAAGGVAAVAVPTILRKLLDKREGKENGPEAEAPEPSPEPQSPVDLSFLQRPPKR